jgi:PASTA domain
MPNMVGKVLQDAQDEIQRVSGNPHFVTSSIDATGQGRHQILDRNWKVCSQSVPAGESFSATTHITLNVVKLSESCR